MFFRFTASFCRIAQLEWFCHAAFNAGLAAAAATDHMSAAVNFGASGSFYAAHPSPKQKDLSNQKVKLIPLILVKQLYENA